VNSVCAHRVDRHPGILFDWRRFYKPANLPRSAELSFSRLEEHRTQPFNAKLQRMTMEAGAPARKTRALRAALVALGGAGAGGFVVAGMARCPVARFLHMPCPACGSARAVAMLVRDHDMKHALEANPLGPPMALVLAAVVARAVFVVARDGDTRALAEGALGRAILRALVALFVVELVVWILRFFGCFGGPVPV
jgi:hypothetical protein